MKNELLNIAKSSRGNIFPNHLFLFAPQAYLHLFDLMLTALQQTSFQESYRKGTGILIVSLGCVKLRIVDSLRVLRTAFALGVKIKTP